MQRPEAHCKGCDYTLKGLPSGECPECGHAFHWDKRTTFRLGDEPGTLRGLYVLRKAALLRLGLVLSPGVLVFVIGKTGWIEIGDWGCMLVLLYPFWLLACTVCALAACSPMGGLGLAGSLLLGVVIAALLGVMLGVVGLIGLGVAGLVMALPCGVVGGLVFKHMQYNDMI